MSKELVVFYSRADENYVSGTLKMLSVGNTEVVANTVRDLTGADIFKIEQAVPYSKGYNECIEEAKVHQQKNARPCVKDLPKSLDGWDIIYLGYPNYWGSMPMAVFTFLESYDFSGKTIRPFCTHEGSGMGRSVADIKKICPAAVVEDGLAVYGSRAGRAGSEIERWILKK